MIFSLETASVVSITLGSFSNKLPRIPNPLIYTVCQRLQTKSSTLILCNSNWLEELSKLRAKNNNNEANS